MFLLMLPLPKPLYLTQPLFNTFKILFFYYPKFIFFPKIHPDPYFENSNPKFPLNTNISLNTNLTQIHPNHYISPNPYTILSKSFFFTAQNSKIFPQILPNPYFENYNSKFPLNPYISPNTNLTQIHPNHYISTLPKPLYLTQPLSIPS